MKTLKRLLQWTALSSAVLLIAALSACAWINWSAGAEIERELERIRKAGEPVNLSEIEPPPVPEDRNAAPLLMAALERLKGDAEIAASFDGDGRVKEGADRLREVVQARADVRKLLREALSRPDCRFEITYEDGFSALLAHIPVMLPGARLLVLEAEDRRNAGDGEGAAQSCLDILRLSATLRLDATLVAHLVRLTMIDLALRTLPGLPLTVDQERELRQAVEGPQSLQASFQDCLRAERALGIQLYEELIGGSTRSAEGLGVPAAAASWAARPYLRLDMVKYLGAMRECITLAGEDVWRARSRMEAIRWPRTTLLLPSLCGMLATAIERCFEHQAVHVARLNGALLSSMVRRTGEMPPDAPLDPFSGKPYGFRKGPEGFSIWSVGKDGVDDGGDPAKDIVWTQGR